MSAIQSVGVIQETRNYGLFDFVKGNRDINRSHVNRLKDKIKRRDLKEIPILVLSKNKQGKYPIFDGQHRFAARSELNKPIRFIVTEKLKADDGCKVYMIFSCVYLMILYDVEDVYEALVLV